ncbi:MAG TPA: amidohydrolase family protein [Lichenihabitans sp.]|jgi:cytosine deaminase|nr:amidohydrolase family protein [Lichenihabitans sp.]
MTFDLVFRNARIARQEERIVDIGVRNGRFEAIEAHLPPGTGPEEVCGGALVLPGFVETHLHLDKSCILGRCRCREGTLSEAVSLVAQAKRDFTEDDVYERARGTLEMAILHGTTLIRSHVEVDPRIGLTGLHALKRLKRDYAWAIEIEICCFPQEGLLDDPGCDAVLVAALEQGADLIGGAPYIDRDAHGQIARIFGLARSYDLDIDLHLDFSLDATTLDAEEVCRQTDIHRWGGRVAIGHASKLSMLEPARFATIARRLAEAGVAVTVLPATDLYLMGRDRDHAVPRGVAPAHRLIQAGVNCSLATNNVLNPFTPFGDGSALRMANLYANVAQRGTPEGLAECFDMTTSRAAALMRRQDYAIAPGCPADLVMLDSRSRAEAVATLAPALVGYKAGRKVFERPRPVLHRPTGGAEAAGGS